MSDEYVTKEVFELQMQNTTLTITKNLGELLDDKFKEQNDKFNKANLEKRDQVIEAVTGFPWEEKDNVKKAVQYAHKRAEQSEDTKRKVKHVILGAGVLGAYTWAAKQFNFPWW